MGIQDPTTWTPDTWLWCGGNCQCVFQYKDMLPHDEGDCRTINCTSPCCPYCGACTFETWEYLDDGQPRKYWRKRARMPAVELLQAGMWLPMYPTKSWKFDPATFTPPPRFQRKRKRRRG